METSQTTIFCQIGFGYKKTPEDVYFHAPNGEAIWFEITINDIEACLDPFSMEDLVAGKIDFDLLPQVLRDTINKLALRTFEVISKDSPQESAKLDPTDAEALFYAQEVPKYLN